MIENLAVVTGFGSLSEEVLTLAGSLPGGYTRYMIKPWLPLLSDPVRTITEVFTRSRDIIGIDPFYFAQIEKELHSKKIRFIFFTGDFPHDRFWQVGISEKIWGQFGRIADEKCMSYFQVTPNGLSIPVRYFLSLSRLISDLGVKALLAHQVFPELNLPRDFLAPLQLPQQISDSLPDVIVQLARKLEITSHERNRFAQAAIVDNGIIVDTETVGTNELLSRYAKRAVKRVMPYLLKPPSAEFDPALDQPTIGPITIDYCKMAGIRGIVVCSETTTIANINMTLKRITEEGMFLYGLPFNRLREIYVRHFPDTWTRNASIDVPPQ
jgi:DUF1009 family protein